MWCTTSVGGDDLICSGNGSCDYRHRFSPAEKYCEYVDYIFSFLENVSNQDYLKIIMCLNNIPDKKVILR